MRIDCNAVNLFLMASVVAGSISDDEEQTLPPQGLLSAGGEGSISTLAMDPKIRMEDIENTANKMIVMARIWKIVSQRLWLYSSDLPNCR